MRERKEYGICVLSDIQLGVTRAVDLITIAAKRKNSPLQKINIVLFSRSLLLLTFTKHEKLPERHPVKRRSSAKSTAVAGYMRPEFHRSGLQPP